MKNNWPKYFIGPLLSILIYFYFDQLSADQRIFLAIFIAVIFNWLLTDIPLFLTGIFGVTSAVLFGVVGPNEALSPFAHPIIFLFMGGYILAQGFQKTGLDKKITSKILDLSFIKGNYFKVSLCFIFISYFFSMWISNTATTALMLPLILGLFSKNENLPKKDMSLLLIFVAFASSIGGITTPVGSTPNAIALGLLNTNSIEYPSFIEWIFKLLPISLTLLCFLFFIVYIKVDKKVEIQTDHQVFKIFKKDLYLILVFLLVVALWTLPGITKILAPSLINSQIIKSMNTGVVAILGSCLLFIFPLEEKTKILEISDLNKIDWPSLLLFGAGLSLGKILFSCGLASIISSKLILLFDNYSFFTVMSIIFCFTIFFTEISSNTATANILIPIIISICLKLGLSPLYPVIFVATACSLAFMLPVATPPNAIVYGTGHINKNTMIKYGLILNILSIIVLAFAFNFYN